jgi:hypothetical protein
LPSRLISDADPVALATLLLSKGMLIEISPIDRVPQAYLSLRKK